MRKTTAKIILSGISLAGALIIGIAAEKLHVPYLFFFSGWLVHGVIHTCREVDRLMQDADAEGAE